MKYKFVLSFQCFGLLFIFDCGMKMLSRRSAVLKLTDCCDIEIHVNYIYLHECYAEQRQLQGAIAPSCSA